MIKTKIRNYKSGIAGRCIRRVKVWKLGRLTIWRRTIWRETAADRQAWRDKQRIEIEMQKLGTRGLHGDELQLRGSSSAPAQIRGH